MDKKTELKICSILKGLGVSPGINGYRYLRKAIMLALEDDTYLEAVTKRLYPDVADFYGTTKTRVERSIRHAVEFGWLRGNVDLMDELFGYTIDVNKGKPTNGEYIATIADYIKTSEGSEEEVHGS